MIKFKFEIGDLLFDIVTGFEGVVMAASVYATGCIHYGLMGQSLPKPGEALPQWEWFDESRLELKQAARVKFNVKLTKGIKAPSGAFPNAPQM